MALSKFRVGSKGYHEAACSSMTAAVQRATSLLNNKNFSYDELGIYQLVKIVKIKRAPVEIEDVAVCEDAPCKKSKEKK